MIKQKCYHKASQCKGHHCCFHNPSKHHMNKWPMHIRLDRGGLTERKCAHGIGHPDPDSLAWLNRMGSEDEGVHGCDGCCHAD